MIRFPNAAAFADRPCFDASEMLQGSRPQPERADEPGRIDVVVDGIPDTLCFYGRVAGPEDDPPLIYLEGDSSRRDAGTWTVFEGYARQSPSLVQRWAEQVAVAMNRTFVVLARPGVYGSSGNHQERRRPREVALVDAALSALTAAFGLRSLDLGGFSGGGHLVASLMAKRSDIGCAVIASGNVAVRQRNAELGLDADITGFADFVDPIALVAEVARHPPQHVVVLTDPEDRIVSAACQTAYVAALRGAGVAVDHRLLPALEPSGHALNDAVLLAAAACPAKAPVRRS